jgi:hypothetical protein
MERTGSCRAFNAFVKSAAGSLFREHDGGELMSALRNGDLSQMVYSYRLQKNGRGSMSRFVTLDGAKELLERFPGVDETVLSKLRGVFESGSMSFLAFSQATPEQCARDEEDEATEEVFDNGGLEEGGTMSSVSPERMWFESRLLYYRSMSDRQIMDERLKAKEAEKATLEERLKVKDVGMTSEKAILEERLKVKDAEMCAKNEKAEKEKALLENAHLREKAEFEARMKDMEIEKLKMQNEMDKLLQGRPPPPKAHPSRKRTSTSDPVDDEEDEAYGLFKASPLLTMTPYDDPVTCDPNRVQRRRWVVAYASDKALEPADFDGCVRNTTTTSFGNGEFLTMLTFCRRARLTVVQPIMQELLSKGRITGRVLVETCFNATLRFDVSSVANDSIKAHMLRSPSVVRGGGGLGCRMMVVE